MNRTKEIKVRFSEDELNKLNHLVLLSGLSREEYVRSILRKTIPSNKPTPNFIETIKQLRAIGNNLNQITMIAHKTGSIDILRYKHDMQKLETEIMHILSLYNAPIEIEVD
ncbi:MAG: plasmid mobilization relaxosome protein MobC [Bacilli bacterium]